MKHAEAFESALRDQSKLADNTEDSVSRVSDHRKSKKARQQQQQQQQLQQQQR